MTLPASIIVACNLSRSAFSGERVVRVPLVDGREYIGVAPTHYCLTGNGQAIGPDVPPPGKTIEGRVEARLIENAGGVASISMPDSVRIRVKSKDVLVQKVPADTWEEL